MIAVMPSPVSLETLTERIQDVSSLPHIAMSVLDVVNRPGSSVADLRFIVESDPALVARVLRTVNSSAYALRSQVESIHRAIALLGFSVIKNLAVTASVAQIFKDSTPVGTYTRPGLWKHLLSVGVGARLIAARSGLSQFDEAYMCGLLHDFGIVLIDQHLHEPFVELMSCAEPRSLVEIEQQLLGFDHTQLGAAVAAKWKFPRSVVNAIHHHHDSAASDPEDLQIVRAVEIANFLCSCKGITSIGRNQVRPPSQEAFSSLSIGRADLKVLWEDLDKELQKSEELFNL